MALLFHIWRTRLIVTFAALAVTINLGCRQAEQIHTYSTPKETKPAVAAEAPVAKPGEPTDRMLAAIVPAGDRAWFFKVVGPIAAVDKVEKELNNFFTSIRFGDDGKPKWELPSGWKEEAGSGMRAATIVIPTDAKPLEVTVNALPWTGTPDDMLRNVNRWRGQLQLPAVETPQVAEFTHEAKAGDRPMTIVDLRGQFAGSGMAAPFAGGAAVAPGAAAPQLPSGLPPGHPPIDSAEAKTPQSTPPEAAPATLAPAGAPEFTAPAGWQSLPAGGMRKAAFAIGDKEHGALVTLISFPAGEGPMIADPLQNVNRWRREVGLDEVKQEDLSKASESIEIDGKPSTYVRAIPDASQASQSQTNGGTLAAMAKSGDQIWFVKLTGDRKVVTAQEAAFKTFLKSLRFAADAGATDGHK